MNNIFHVEKGKAKKQVTTLGTVSASGDILPPFILLPYTRRAKWMDLLPREVNYTLSPSGWMTAVSFLSFLKEQFVVKLKDMGVQFPVILFIDGVSSHLSLEISGMLLRYIHV
jgi:DDE superfamily endonuclease